MDCWSSINIHWDLSLQSLDMIIRARTDFGSHIFREIFISACWIIWKAWNGIIFDTKALFRLIIRTFQLIFSAGTVFFSHKKSANSVFQPAYQHSRTGPKLPPWWIGELPSMKTLAWWCASKPRKVLSWPSCCGERAICDPLLVFFGLCKPCTLYICIFCNCFVHIYKKRKK
jgi:hypothetical protein